jgi:hypothetical protein
LLALAALALPASSFAQSAGDDQYQDPLAGQGGSSGGGGGSTGGGSTGGGGSGSTRGSSTPTTTASAPSSANTTASGTQSGAATGAQTASGQLPRTGFDVIITIELGVAMLLSGLVAQRLLVLRDRRPDRH